MLTVDELRRIAPRCDAEHLAPLFTSVALEYGIDTKLRFMHWLAQMDEETGGFTKFVENMNYSAEGLMKTWPSRFGPATAAAYAHKPEMIANLVYANRMGNGPPESGDGWRYRGRGEIGITGRAAYEEAAKNLNDPNLVNDPDRLVAGFGEEGIRAAADFWHIHGCNAAADRDDIVAITKIVNGGLIGLVTRKAAYANIVAVLAADPAITPPAQPKAPTVTDAPTTVPAPGPAAPAAAPTPPAIGAMNTGSIARLVLGALGMWLLNHHVLPDNTSETAFVNGLLPVAVWGGTALWITAKNRLHLTRFYQALAATP